LTKGPSVRAEPTTEKSAVRPGIFTAVNEYVKDVRIEMSKVSWPTREELRESTLVVIVMVFVIAIFIGIVDRALSLAFEAIIKMVG
jgi:preprotein translocase subunit SecE